MCPSLPGQRERKHRHIGHLLWKIAAAPTPSTLCSFGRAMATLRRAGLIEVRHSYAHPYLRISPRHPRQYLAAFGPT